MGTTVVMLEIQIKPECVDEVKALLKEALPDTSAYAGFAGLFSFAQTEFVKTTLRLLSLGEKFPHDNLLCHITCLPLALNYLLIHCFLRIL